MKRTLAALCAGVLLASGAWAKLPPPSEEQKAAAEAAKAKAAENAAKAKALLEASMDRVVASYKEAKAKGLVK